MRSAESHWQGNIDCCALPQFRLAAYGATVILNDSIYDGKSQASALTHLFGGVEGLENLVESVRLNPSARVGKWYPGRGAIQPRAKTNGDTSVSALIR